MKNTFVKKSIPAILSVTAAVGVALTGYYSAMAGAKAKEHALANPEEPTDWKIWLPAIGAGTGTVICIFSAQFLGARNQTSLASAYALADQAYKNYTGKVKELYGEEVHNRIVDSIAREKASDPILYATDFSGNASLDFGVEEKPVLFYDSFANRYFESTMTHVLQAEYHLNRNYVLGGCVTLNDLYEFLGIEKTAYGDIVGWAISSELYWIDFAHRKVVLEDGSEYYTIDMIFPPNEEDLENW